jgi:hypothetical protein
MRVYLTGRRLSREHTTESNAGYCDEREESACDLHDVSANSQGTNDMWRMTCGAL